MAEDKIGQIWHRPKKIEEENLKLTQKITVPNRGKKIYEINMKTEKKEILFITVLKKKVDQGIKLRQIKELHFCSRWEIYSP